MRRLLPLLCAAVAIGFGTRVTTASTAHKCTRIWPLQPLLNLQNVSLSHGPGDRLAVSASALQAAEPVVGDEVLVLKVASGRANLGELPLSRSARLFWLRVLAQVQAAPSGCVLPHDLIARVTLNEPHDSNHARPGICIDVPVPKACLHASG